MSKNVFLFITPLIFFESKNKDKINGVVIAIDKKEITSFCKHAAIRN